MFFKRTKLQTLVTAVVTKLPISIMRILQTMMFRNTDQLQIFNATAEKIARDIVEREVQASRGQSPEGRDIMSNLGKS
jgi:hypothetical protein